MRKITLSFLCLGLVLTVGCSGQQGTGDNDSASNDSAAVAESPKAPVDQITAEGVGPLKLGMPMDEVPASVEGLYDSFKKEKVDEWGDECLVSYKLYFIKGDKTIFECIADDGDCTRKYVIADFLLRGNPTVKIDIDGTLYGCGDDVAELIDNKVITVKGNGPFDKSVYLYNGVELQLKTDIHGNVKKNNRVIADMRILNADYMTPFPEDFVP